MDVFKAHLVEASEMEASQGSADNKNVQDTAHQALTAMDQGKKSHKPFSS